MSDEYEQGNGPIELDDDARRRLGPGVRELLQMSEDEIIRAKEDDEERIQSLLESVEEKDEEDGDDPQPGLRSFRPRPELAPHPIFGAVIIDPERIRPVRIEAILNFGGNADDLAALGIEVHTGVHDVFTIVATRRQLADLAAQPATRRVKLPRAFDLHLADATRAAEVDQIHALGNQGQGVIVGIIDTALNVEHRAFRDPAGNHDTRVLYMWDQCADFLELPGQTPHQYHGDRANHPDSPAFSGLKYGLLYDAAYIKAALSGGGNIYGDGPGQIATDPATTPEGHHGTAVAGVAAGSGHDAVWAQGANVGAAPQADIVFVALKRKEDCKIDALRFIFDVAFKTGRPAVINCSSGNYIGPHDGKSDYDSVRDAMLFSHHGRSIVVAAGNDNDDEGFRHRTITAGQTEQTWNVRPVLGGGVASGTLLLDIWYTGPELDYHVACGPNTTGWITAGQEYRSKMDGQINGYDIRVDRDVEPRTDMRNIRLRIEQPAADTWMIQLRNPSASDVNYWAWTGEYADLDGFTTGELTLADTACCKSVISVGACDKPAGGSPEMISDYSGRGPTLDGRIKPELVVVGTGVSTADGSSTGAYVSWKGTSFAAPLVAGAVALLFEDNPTLNQDTIKGLLTQHADRTNLNIDPAAAGYDPIERNAYGYGRLRMLAPFQFIHPPGEVDVWVRTAADDYGLEPYPGGVFWNAPEVTVLDPSGNETSTLEWGKEHTVKVRIHNLGNRVALNTTVSLKYARPWTAPDDWEPCRGPGNKKLEEVINITPLTYVDLTFAEKWKPVGGVVPAGSGNWGDHYCLLVEVSHDGDPLGYDSSSAAGQDPWNKNIKGTNNVALRNLHIH